MYVQHTLILFFATCSFTTSQGTGGCPVYGCRPSGSFSFQQNVPRKNASIHWTSQFSIGPVPEARGCVGNSVQLICQFYGPAGDDTGFMSVSLDNGAVRWRDPILRFPSLPILGTNGDVIGSDGNNLVHYDQNGKLMASVINLEPSMQPIYSLHLVGERYVLLVSKAGQIAVRDKDGERVAEMFLNGTVERDRGTFIPVASPVSYGNRFYLLTEFVPESGQIHTPSILGLQRLYAIDILDTTTDRVKVAWYANFEREGLIKHDDDTKHSTKLKFRPKHRKQILQKQPEMLQPSLLWDNVFSMIYVSLPPPKLNSRAEAMPSFWGLKDNGTNADFVFRSSIAVTNMVLFELDAYPRHFENVPTSNAKPDSDKTLVFNRRHAKQNKEANTKSTTQILSPNHAVPYAGSQLWVSLADGKICAVEKDGNLSKVLDLPAKLKADVQITSKMSTVRHGLYEEDVLVFGIKVTKSSSDFRSFLLSCGVGQTNATAFLVAIDTPENLNDSQFPVSWMVPTPNDTVVTGQIVGSKGDNNRLDQLIFFAQKEGEFSKLVSIV